MGIRMGNGFIEDLETPADQKDYVTNSIRTQHGDSIVAVRPKLTSRSVTLEFVIIGTTRNGKTAHDDYESKKDAFLELLHNGYMTISVPYSRTDVYRLWAQMKSTTYGKGISEGGAIGKMSVKFLEANPTDRGAFNDNDTLMLNVPEYDDFIK